MLYADFDEYALYELRDLDVGGLDFMYPPAGLRLMARPWLSGRSGPGSAGRRCCAYPLIVTRRDPTASDPPSAYRLVWQGTYYQVWARRARRAGGDRPSRPVEHAGGWGSAAMRERRAPGADRAAHGGHLVAADATASS